MHQVDQLASGKTREEPPQRSSPLSQACCQPLPPFSLVLAEAPRRSSPTHASRIKSDFTQKMLSLSGQPAPTLAAKPPSQGLNIGP